jgi:hypothetical protein
VEAQVGLRGVLGLRLVAISYVSQFIIGVISGFLTMVNAYTA